MFNYLCFRTSFVLLGWYQLTHYLLKGTFVPCRKKKYFLTFRLQGKKTVIKLCPRSNYVIVKHKINIIPPKKYQEINVNN